MRSSRYRSTIATLLGREKQVRSLPDGGELRVCLAYPNSYRVGMASLGFQVVRRLFARAGCRVERTFMPGAAEERGLGAAAGPLVAWESLEPPGRFELLAFSVPFELDYTNLVRMLLLSGLPPRAADRHQDHPLVIAGGAAATINPRPLSPFLDAVVLGESERPLPLLAETVSELRGDRVALLGALAELPGVYVPALHDDPESRRLEPPLLLPADIALSDAVSADAEFGESVLMEVGRGCSMGCRFCWAGWACRPPRGHDLEAMLAAVDTLPPESDRIGLIASSHFDHPQFMDLIRGLRRRGKRLAVSALRIDQLDDELLACLAESGTRSVALAPETGCESLRRRVGKRISDEQVVDAAHRVAEAGLRSLKLYFLVGLPGETAADVEAIPDLVGRIAEAAGGRLRLSLSVNIFIPKPGTPWGGEPLAAERELRRRLRRLRRGLSCLPGLEVATMAPWEAVLQTLLGRGGEELGELLLRAAEEGWSLRRLRDEAPPEWIERYVYGGGLQAGGRTAGAAEDIG